jgi:hypothetical protein
VPPVPPAPQRALYNEVLKEADVAGQVMYRALIHQTIELDAVRRQGCHTVKFKRALDHLDMDEGWELLAFCILQSCVISKELARFKVKDAIHTWRTKQLKFPSIFLPLA